MKKYIYIFAFLGLSLCNQSCMNKLEILPNDQIITDNFFEKGTAEEIESGVNSMYQRLQSSYMYNLRMWTLVSILWPARGVWAMKRAATGWKQHSLPIL